MELTATPVRISRTSPGRWTRAIALAAAVALCGSLPTTLIGEEAA
jgi:hypothetical protein